MTSGFSSIWSCILDNFSFNSALLYSSNSTFLSVNRPCFMNSGTVACKRGERGKLRCTVMCGHRRARRGCVVRQIDHVVVWIHHALCPPICRLRDAVVAPSSRFIPFRMAFLPYLFFILIMASCIFFSRASAASSAAFFF